MLKFSKAQMDGMAGLRAQRYKRELGAYLAGQFPQLAERAGHAAMAEFTEQAFERADKERLHRCGPVRLYAETCLLCGLDFADDPQHSALTETRPLHHLPERQRAERLFERVGRYYEACIGEAAGELARFAEQAFALESRAPESLASDRALSAVCELWPAKARFAGRTDLHAAVARAIESGPAARAAIVSPWRRTWLSVGFGAGLNTNPLYQWLDVAPDEQTKRLRDFVASLKSPVPA